MQEIRTEDLIYFAGFFDGEGCVSCQEPYRNPRPYLIFANNNKNVLEQAQQLFGGKIYQQSKWRCWQLFIMKAEEVEKTATALLPFIRIKKKQLQLAILFARVVQLHKVGPNPMLQEHMDLRIKFSLALKIENQKRGVMEACGVNTNIPIRSRSSA